MSAAAIPAALAQQIRDRGTQIDPPATKALYREQPAVVAWVAHVRSELPYGNDPRQVLDVYRDSAPSSGALQPALVYLHGGGFIRGDKGERANAGRCLAAQQIVTILPNYRLGPDHRWPAGAEDAAAAFAWVLAHADALGVDPARIYLGGESAGAAHAAAAGLVARFGVRPAGLLLSSGVYNVELESLCRVQFGIATPDPRNDAYFGTDMNAMRAMSTVRLVDVAPLPVWISYAELDPVQMQVQAGELFATLVTQHGFAPEITCIAGHNHLSQVYAINTGDASLSGPMRDFILGRP